MFFCALRVGHWHIYTCLCSYPGEFSSTINVTASTDNSVPTLNSTTMLSSSQVVFFFFHVRREFCLKPSLFSLTVLPANGVQTHCNLGMPNVRTSKVNICKKTTLPESVSPQAHSDTNKDVVIHLHLHWLQGPKCKQTQLTEAFAPIKH